MFWNCLEQQGQNTMAMQCFTASLASLHLQQEMQRCQLQGPKKPQVKEGHHWWTGPVEVVLSTQSTLDDALMEQEIALFRRLRRRLWKLLRVAWVKNFLTDSWLIAGGMLHPEGRKLHRDKTIPYHLTPQCGRGKIFFGILTRRLTTFMLDNDYMDTSVQ